MQGDLFEQRLKLSFEKFFSVTRAQKTRFHFFLRARRGLNKYLCNLINGTTEKISERRVGRPSDGRRTVVRRPSDGRRTAVRWPSDGRPTTAESR